MNDKNKPKGCAICIGIKHMAGHILCHKCYVQSGGCPTELPALKATEDSK